MRQPVRFASADADRGDAAGLQLANAHATAAIADPNADEVAISGGGTARSDTDIRRDRRAGAHRDSAAHFAPTSPESVEDDGGLGLADPAAVGVAEEEQFSSTGGTRGFESLERYSRLVPTLR